jgi:hypothetical protein
MLTVPLRYIPLRLTRKERKQQAKMLIKSRKLYKQQKYYTRKALPSYKHQTSKHIVKARRLYKLATIGPTTALAKATGCSINALKRIIQKGEGAYFSSGSRPNQTAQSWGVARLASAVTGGKASAVDFKILEKGCKHNKPAYKLAKRNKTNSHRHKVPKTPLSN